METPLLARGGRTRWRRRRSPAGRGPWQVPQVALDERRARLDQFPDRSGHVVFDQLYGRDEAMNALPQMVGQDLVENNATRWTLKRGGMTERKCWRATASPPSALDEAQPRPQRL